MCSQCACNILGVVKVTEIKTRNNAVTLAIGDGNNDEQMIIEADIGVGIAGVEGSGAVSTLGHC